MWMAGPVTRPGKMGDSGEGCISDVATPPVGVSKLEPTAPGKWLCGWYLGLTTALAQMGVWEKDTSARATGPWGMTAWSLGS